MESPIRLDDLSTSDLKQLVVELLGRVSALEATVSQQRDEIARLKGLPPRPAIKPSGMDKATERRPGMDGSSKAKRPRGSKREQLVVTEEQVLKADVPAGSRFKGYEDVVVQDLFLAPRVIRYRRERWRTASGETIVAPLPDGVIGGFGPGLHRFILAGHIQGQVTSERLTALLEGIGVAISKRQVVRLMSGGLDHLIAEDSAVLRSGLETARWITVDDTGARHANRNGYTTQIGDERFTSFRTGFSKSRANFLSLLRAGYCDYVVNEAALAYMRSRNLAGAVIKRLTDHPQRQFANQAAWQAHLDALGISALKVTPEPVKIATEAALWGTLHHHGFLADATVVSDGAGQFRIGRHALCWVHAERLVHQLEPVTEPQRKAVERQRHLIWQLYYDLKAYKEAPCRRRAAQLRARFDRIFKPRTCYVTLNRLLARLHARKSELLRVLDHPEIPLHTNGSESDIRAHVTKRRISGGTQSEAGQIARDVLLGLMKTCQKLALSFFHYLGSRLHVQGAPEVNSLTELIAQRA